jgi:hypothetical protein
VSEQVVYFLETVEIEAEHGETFALGQVGNFLVDPGVEMAAVGKRCQHVVMREIMDVLFGLLARLQVANGYDMMRPSGKHDRPQDQLDRRHRAVEMAQAGFDRLVRSGQQFGARGLVRKTGFEPGAGETGSGQAGQVGEACVDRDDLVAIANQQAFHGRIREIAHPVDFQFRAASVADVEHDASQCQPDNREARDCYADREPAGRQRRWRDLDGGIGNDRHRTHCRKVMTADRERQQHGAADFPFLFAAVKTDG